MFHARAGSMRGVVTAVNKFGHYKTAARAASAECTWLVAVHQLVGGSDSAGCTCKLNCGLWFAGGMPDSAIASFSKMLPSGRPDEAATAAFLRKREREGLLGQEGRFILDSSQILSIATAVLNPLALLHGPPGTGELCWTPAWQRQPL